MNGLRFRIGQEEHVIVSFRQHRSGGADSCLIRLSVRLRSLQASEESWVAKSDLAQFVASIQATFESLTGGAALHHESGSAWLSIDVGRRGQIKVSVQLAGNEQGPADDSLWRAQAEFSFYPQGNLRFSNAGGLDVNRRYLEDMPPKT